MTFKHDLTKTELHAEAHDTVCALQFPNGLLDSLGAKLLHESCLYSSSSRGGVSYLNIM